MLSVIIDLSTPGRLLMKKQCNPKAFAVMSILLVLNLLVFWSIRSMWSGIIAIVGKPAPYLFAAILALTTLAVTICSLYKKQPLSIAILGYILDIIFLALNGYMLSETLDSWHYFIREFFYGFAFIGIIVLIVYLIFFNKEAQWIQKKWFPPVLGIFLFVIGFFAIFDIQLINGIEKTPVVYAVEDTYQITFTTKAKGEAWVVINGVEYNDTYAGYRRSEDTIHKITVPMEVLDNANSYSVYTRAMYLRGPYCALQGPTISQTVNWRGVDTTDGLNYYVFSDNHLTTETVADAAGYWGEDLDFLISLGDTVNWIDSENELSLLLHLASNITQGEIPVIYARGNHETKGLVADDYHKYVGSKNENFYYTFRMKNIWGVVLDVGEDHEDTHWEFSDMARFDTYRAEQLGFLDEIIANADNEYAAEGVDYRLGICHIPVTFAQPDDPLLKQKFAWVERLNQMNLDIMYNGHLHKLMYADANLATGNTLTLTSAYSGKTENNTTYQMAGTNFPTCLVSKRGQMQLATEKENVFGKYFIGVAASFDGNKTILKYTNEVGEIVETISPWYEGMDYGEEIRVKH